MDDAWFDEPKTLYSISPPPHFGSVETWFYQGGYKVTLIVNLRTLIDGRNGPPCLERQESTGCECVLPLGHETKHLPMSSGDLRQFDGIRVERLKVEA
jgi:hypothetical protein